MQLLTALLTILATLLILWWVSRRFGGDDGRDNGGRIIPFPGPDSGGKAMDPREAATCLMLGIAARRDGVSPAQKEIIHAQICEHFEMDKETAGRLIVHAFETGSRRRFSHGFLTHAIRLCCR